MDRFLKAITTNKMSIETVRPPKNSSKNTPIIIENLATNFIINELIS